MAKQIKKKGALKVGQIQVKVKAPIASFGADDGGVMGRGRHDLRRR